MSEEFRDHGPHNTADKAYSELGSKDFNKELKQGKVHQQTYSSNQPLGGFPNSDKGQFGQDWKEDQAQHTTTAGDFQGKNIPKYAQFEGTKASGQLHGNTPPNPNKEETGGGLYQEVNSSSQRHQDQTSASEGEQNR